jgi:hypothetical protein
MLHKNDSPPHCPKCNELMRTDADPPRFAQFLPWRSFKCDLCQTALSFSDNEGEGMHAGEDVHRASMQSPSKLSPM